MADNAKYLRPFPKGVIGNPSGRPKSYNRVRKLFQKALDGTESYTEKNPTSLAKVILRHAFDDTSRNQGKAWDIVLAYGLGMPPKDLTPETVTAMAEQIVEGMLEKARAKAAEKAALDAAIEVKEKENT